MIYIITWLVCGFICSMIAGAKGRGAGTFFVLGVLFGPLGVVLCAVVPRNDRAIEQDAVKSGDMKKCPHCAEVVKAEANICKHCRSSLAEEKKTNSPARDLYGSPGRLETICRCGQVISFSKSRIGEAMECPGCFESVDLLAE